MSKNQKINNSNWKDYEDDSQVLYSYIKKKGKHQRAKKAAPNKKL